MFEHTIEKLVALAALMPVVASMSGNTGIQTVTVAVRGIATRELTSTNALRVVIKEICVSATNGVLLGTIAGIVSYLIHKDLYLTFVFSAAILMALTISGIIGSTVPLLLHKVKIDPAISSGIFLTAVTDISSFFIFLGLASLLLI